MPGFRPASRRSRNTMQASASGTAGGAFGPPAVAISAGAAVLYRAMAGGWYLAKVLRARPDGRLDLDVDAGGERALFLSRIECRRSEAECGPGECHAGA